MSHKHKYCHCNHDLRYCSCCDVVYCTKCNREWEKPQQKWYPYPNPYKWYETSDTFGGYTYRTVTSPNTVLMNNSCNHKQANEES